MQSSIIGRTFLFAALITYPRMLPPVGALPRWGKLFARVIAWALAWLAGAAVITYSGGAIPGGGVLLTGGAIFAILFMAFAWSRNSPG